MRWPPWSANTTTATEAALNGDTKQVAKAGDDDNGWFSDPTPRTYVTTLVLTSTILGLYAFYRTHLKRIPVASCVQASFFSKRSLYGKVTRVGDGDNFHLFHTPGGWLAGWGWLRRIPEWTPKHKRTIAIRIAGIDAPEGAHFGKPAQPYSAEALEWLQQYILTRSVRAYPYKQDQYSRIVATVYVRRWLLRRDVGLQMLKQGLATIYEAKSGAEFGDLESEYRAAEALAKRKHKGIWSISKGTFESPRAYKTRTTTTATMAPQGPGHAATRPPTWTSRALSLFSRNP